MQQPPQVLDFLLFHFLPAYLLAAPLEVLQRLNPDSDYSSTITLRVVQDGVGGYGVTWPASIVWAGGTAPTVTSTANASDIYGFTTYDSGVTWYGFSLGQDFS